MIDPETSIVKPLIIDTPFGIFLFSKSALFVKINEVENKTIDPNKEEDKII